MRADHTVAYANRAFVRRYGRQDFAGRSCYERFSSTSRRAAPNAASAVRLRARPSRGRPRRCCAGSSGRRACAISSSAARRSRGRTEERCSSWSRLRTETAPGAPESQGVVAESPATKAVLEKISLVTALDVPVLFIGPSGSGKREFARLLHENSRRAAHSFLCVDCRGLTPAKLSRGSSSPPPSVFPAARCI